MGENATWGYLSESRDPFISTFYITLHVSPKSDFPGFRAHPSGAINAGSEKDQRIRNLIQPLHVCRKNNLRKMHPAKVRSCDQGPD